MPDAEKLAAVREALPALAAGIYLNTGSAGPLPAETAAAMDEIATRELRTGRAHPDDFLFFLDRMGEARAGIAAILGADVDEVAITHATTEGMNIATWAVDWKPGQRAVTTTHEHPGGLAPLLAVRDRFGVAIDFVDVPGDADDDAIVRAFDEAIGPETRLVSVSHVLWTTGARLPVERIVEVAHRRGALVVIDGAQAVGAIPVSVEQIGADFYAVAGEKWLLGPEGTGALWAARDAIARAAPSLVGWFSYETIGLDGAAVYHRSARRFEATNYHRPSVVGLARSCGWLSMYVGLPWAIDRGTALARVAVDRLTAIPGVSVLTPRDRMASLVTFRIGGWGGEAAVDELGSRVFAITRAIVPLDAIRISVGFFNTEAEIERFAAAVELLARHTPETLPPKTRLAIFGQDDG